MIQALFSYSGRMGRAPFIRWSIAQVVLSGLLLAGMQGFSADAITQLQSSGRPGGQVTNVGMILVLGVAVVVFPSSALLIKRLRDVGLPAWPCLIVISLVDALVSNVVPQSSQFTQGPFAGLAFSVLVSILLAFVPGRGSAVQSDDVSADWVERAARAETRLVEQRRGQQQGETTALGQLQALEAIRRQAASRLNEPQGFGRRRTHR